MRAIGRECEALGTRENPDETWASRGRDSMTARRLSSMRGRSAGSPVKAQLSHAVLIDHLEARVERCCTIQGGFTKTTRQEYVSSVLVAALFVVAANQSSVIVGPVTAIAATGIA